MLNIIIVSHGHEDYIKSLLTYLNFTSTLNDGCRIIVKDNKKSYVLESLCQTNNIIYCQSERTMGFGENNNYAVKFIKDNYGVQDDDYFLFLNPDILLSQQQLRNIIANLNKNKYAACTIDLFKDEALNERDYFIRTFPSAKDFFSSYVLGKNDTIIDRSGITQPVEIDWCAGSFMVFRADVFLKLNGFDESYFMYCEDLDICYRLKLTGYKLTYLPQLHAIHYAQHANRKIFSKPFYWHLKSVMRYLFKTSLYKRTHEYSKKTTSILKKS